MSTPSADTAAQPTSMKNWLSPIICAVITTLGAGYTAYSTHATQSEVEVLRAKSEEQVAKIKSDTAYQVKQAEFRAQQDILRLKSQLDTEKEQRDKINAAETAAMSLRSKRCTDIKEIRDEMSVKIPHIRYGDPLVEAALLSLQAAAHKSSSYLSVTGREAFNSAMPKEDSKDPLGGQYEYYRALLQGYNAELRTGCIQ